MNNHDVELAEVVVETNAVVIPDPVAVQLRADLGPVADRIALYEQQVAEIQVRNQAEADAAVEFCERVKADIKLVKGHDVLSKITDGLRKLHKRWTGARDMFVKPLETVYKTARDRYQTWLDAEEKAATALAMKLQAEAETKVRQEQARLEKQAAKLKTPELKEQRFEEARALTPPVIDVQGPKNALRGVARVWKVARIDDAFWTAVAQDKSLRGYVSIDKTRLQRAKAANPLMDVPGVTFEHVLR